MFSRYCSFETFKNIAEFKHVRLKSSNESLKEKNRLSKEIIKQRSDILCKILNCNIHTAFEIISKNRELDKFSLHNFCNNAKFCKNYLKMSDLIESPSLLTLSSSLLQHRYFSLKELGFYSITPSFIFRFPHILKMKPQESKEKGFSLTFEYKSSILAEYLKVSNRTEINNKLQHMYEDGSDFQKIKEVMNAEFLSAKLGCSIGSAYQMLHKNASLRVQSISNTDQLLNILLYKFGFSISKICNALTLLSAHPETVDQLIEEFPEILGVDTLFLVRRLPLLLKQDYKFIHKAETTLKEFNINKDQLISCPKILSLSLRTLHKRLSYLCSTEDFAVLKFNKKFLWLVYHYKNLNSRLKQLNDEKLPCSIKMFTVSKNTFEKYLLFNDTRRGIKETYIYLADIFKISEKEILDRLRHYSHTQSEDQNCSILNCQRVIEFLLMSGVTKKQIFNGLEIVYFDIDIVKHCFSNLKNDPQCQPYEEWISHNNFVQLLIYIIGTNKYHSYNIEIDENEELTLEKTSNYSL